MIQWKVSVLSFALGALTTVGFVWLRRSRERRSVGRASEVPFDADQAARLDALHDLGDAASELDFTEPAELEPSDVRSFDVETFERATGGERYDAVDPEEVGTEWLKRATEAPVDSSGSHGEEHTGPGKPHG